MQVYLDMNFFQAVVKKEENSEIILDKVNALKERLCIFPYSAAHLEEVAKLTNSNEILQLIDDFSNGKSYIVGNMPKDIARKNVDILTAIINSPHTAAKDLKVYKKVLDTCIKILNLKDDNQDFSTKLQVEDISIYYKRVVGDLYATGVAEQSQVNALGMRTKESREVNGIPDYFKTFESLRSEYEIDHQKLSSLSPENLFKNNKFLIFFESQIKKRGYSLVDIPKGSEITKYHHYKESLFDEVLKIFEIIGYSQEENNKDKTIRNFTHDISHAIYGSSANFFITNDKRFYRKLKALFYFFNIPCEVLNFKEFVEYDFFKN